MLGSRKDFKMNNVSVDMLSGCVVLDARSQSLINLTTAQQQQQQARDANSQLFLSVCLPLDQFLCFFVCFLLVIVSLVVSNSAAGHLVRLVSDVTY